jgi:hypothetical protein
MTQPTPVTASSEPKDFFIPIDVDLVDRLEDEFTPITWAVLCIVLRQVDYKTGIWKGSAARVAAALGGKVKLRTVQDALQSLQESGHLKSFHRRGQRHNYLVAIPGYAVRSGKWAGYTLDAERTTDPKRPVYVKNGATTHRLREGLDKETRKNQPDSELGDVPPRTDCPKTGENELPLRNDCATTAHPHARYLDYPDCLTTTPQNLKDSVGGEKSIGTEKSSSSSPPQKELIAAIVATLRRHNASTASNATHRAQATTLSEEHGADTFLQALDFWLANDGQKWIKGRDWVLAHFVTSGAFEDSLARLTEQRERVLKAHAAAERKRAEAERERSRKMLRETLKREIDRVSEELCAWRDKYDTDDGFVPSSPEAYQLVLLQRQYDDAVSSEDEGCVAIWKKIDQLKNEWVVAREAEVVGVQ